MLSDHTISQSSSNGKKHNIPQSAKRYEWKMLPHEALELWPPNGAPIVVKTIHDLLQRLLSFPWSSTYNESVPHCKFTQEPVQERKRPNYAAMQNDDLIIWHVHFLQNTNVTDNRGMLLVNQRGCSCFMKWHFQTDQSCGMTDLNWACRARYKRTQPHLLCELKDQYISKEDLKVNFVSSTSGHL